MKEADHQNDHLMITMEESNKEQSAQAAIKGKRTKRQRPQSPILFALTITNSNCCGEGGLTNSNSDHHDHDGNYNSYNNSNTTTAIENKFIHSSTTSPEILVQHSAEEEEEEEEMANCLILLAQGSSREISQKHPVNYDHHDHQDQHVVGTYKFNNRRVSETAAGLGVSKSAGYNYGYECKTCNRTFASFQALGGHRASHKKSKALVQVMDPDHRKKHLMGLSLNNDIHDHDQAQTLIKNKYNNNFISSSSLSLQLSSTGTSGGNLYNSNNSKVHECAVCGTEFISGQALGGHMRRHRAPVGTNINNTNTTNTTLSLIPMSLEPDQDLQRKPKRQKSLISMDLDLNLPAPIDEQPQQPKQQQKQQQQSVLLFSAPTLVDCHY